MGCACCGRLCPCRCCRAGLSRQRRCRRRGSSSSSRRGSSSSSRRSRASAGARRLVLCRGRLAGAAVLSVRHPSDTHRLLLRPPRAPGPSHADVNATAVPGPRSSACAACSAAAAAADRRPPADTRPCHCATAFSLGASAALFPRGVGVGDADDEKFAAGDLERHAERGRVVEARLPLE